MPYTVQYISQVTGEKLHADKVVSNNEYPVVTERFLPVTSFVPDAFQKSLVVAYGNPERNVITFYYTPDSEHAYYNVNYYIEDDDYGWYLYNNLEHLESIGTRITAEQISISGYTLDTSVEGTVLSGRVTAQGLELNLYYRKNRYPYEIRYVDNNTSAQLAPSESGSLPYGSVLSKSPLPEIQGYTCINPERTITIALESGTTPTNNILVYRYRMNQAEINYIPITKNGGEGGTVSLANEFLSVATGVPSGSIPTANPRYKFIGWFQNEECTIPVSTTMAEIDAETHELVPLKQDGMFVDTNFYALFQAEDTFSVIYDANGGQGEMSDDTEYILNDEATVLENIFTRPTYEFVEWNTEADGSGTSYEPGDTITMTDDVTLYAIWSASMIVYTGVLKAETLPVLLFVSAGVVAVVWYIWKWKIRRIS